MHLDLSRKFLNIAKTSYTLNGFPIHKRDFQAGDVWPLINRFKREGERFDCVFLDPPFFATTPKGVVDLTQNYAKLINKVRPLINDNGYLIAINNALFLSGAAYLKTLESLCDDHYLKIEPCTFQSLNQDCGFKSSAKVVTRPTATIEISLRSFHLFIKSFR
jgi:23S rRNA (cytosine1962-C5)-methyltransferase